MSNNSRVKTQCVWLAIRLTHLPLEGLGIHRNNDNMIVSYKGRVCATSDNLCAMGIKPGMPASTAQLLHKADDEIPCRTYEREPDSEKKLLDQLCQTLYNYTPHIENYHVINKEGHEGIGLLLELSRCIKLFKGLIPLIEKITDALDKIQVSYHFGQGHSKYMAWLLSYTQQTIDPSHTRDKFILQLNPLDLSYIYEYSDIVVELKKTGFLTFLDITRHIKEASFHSLRKRFGKEFCDHITDIYDISIDLTQSSLFQKPAGIYQPKKIFLESIQFDYPVRNCEQLIHPINTLLTWLTNDLVKQQAQTQCIFWNLYDIHQNHKSLYIRFDRLHRDNQLAIDLSIIQLESQPLPFEVDILELRCEKIFPVEFENVSTRNNTEQHAFVTMTTKLNARLGDQAVFTLSQKDSHIPELSFCKNKVDSNIERALGETVPEPKTERPSWIFNIPVKAGKQQNQLFWKGKLELLQGPERIEGLWWKKPTGRDYFVAKRDDNVRLWVFHDLYKNEWFVHGVFA